MRAHETPYMFKSIFFMIFQPDITFLSSDRPVVEAGDEREGDAVSRGRQSKSAALMSTSVNEQAILKTKAFTSGKTGHGIKLQVSGVGLVICVLHKNAM